mgnify:CR=1 FL=1
MPNINAKVKASVTAICGGKAATSAHIKTADAIFSSVGKVYHIDEDLFLAFGALGGASGALAMNSSEHPIALMNAVCSPGGTTIEGVCKLRELGFDTAVQQALQAIIDKDFFLETN